MPELPEVEAARRAVEENCVGKKIKKAVVANDTKVIEGVSSKEFEAALEGKTVISALRKGKNLWLQLDSPPFPSFQFGMAGAIYIKGVAVTKYKRSAVSDTDEWPSKYSKLFIELDNGLELSFTDKRRFARVRLLDDPASVPPISELGPDALLEPMTVDVFHEALSKKKIGIKALLLDQSFVSGIGNWIADEVLYQVSTKLECIHCILLQVCPKKVVQHCSIASRRLFGMQLKLMLIAVAFLVNGCFIFDGVIEKAIEVGADSSHYPSNWIFHSRDKKPGKAFVDGKKIEFITAGGRTSAYVPELQKLSGTQSTKAADKPKGKTSNGTGGKDDDVDEDGGIEEPASDEDDAKKMKPKRELKPRARGKRAPVKRKSKASDEDDGEDKEAEDSAGNDSADDGDDGDDEEKKKHWRAMNKKPGMAENSTKKAVTNRISKKAVKKVK